MKTTDLNNPFSAVIEKSIQQEVDHMLSEQDPNQNKLLSLEARRAKLEQELHESLDLSELGKHITKASNIIENEGDKYLEKEDYDFLIEGLNNLKKQMSSLEPNNLTDETIRAALKLSPKNLSSILKIGIAKYSAEQFPESLSIFAFLSAIDSQEPDYWYRFGLVAQRSEQYELALRAFDLTSVLAPEFIGSHIFAAECYLKIDQREKAVTEVDEMKAILETTEVDEELKARVTDIENLIGATNK